MIYFQTGMNIKDFLRKKILLPKDFSRSDAEKILLANEELIIF